MTNSPTQSRSTFRKETIVVLGVSTTAANSSGASTQGRELALGSDDVVRVRNRLGELHPHVEHILLATCDRTELILADPAGLDARTALGIWHQSLGIEFAGNHAPCLIESARPFVLTGIDAVEHVLRVACGLESSMLGDADILGQLRTAWHDAQTANTTGQITRQIFRDAFAVGKRARSSTDISAGGAGVGSAVSTTLETCQGSVLIIGAGPAGRTIARRLAKSSSKTSDTISDITITNRTAETAEVLASEIGARTVDMVTLDDALLDADVVITATGATQPILTSERLERLRRSRPGWTPKIIDVGAPSNVEATPGFEIISLDGLTQRTDATSNRRAAAVPLVEAFITDVLGRRYNDPSHTSVMQCMATHVSVSVSNHLADLTSADPAQRSALS